MQAALCALRVIKKVPDLADHFIAKAKNLLADRNHGVLLTAITLVIDMVQADPGCLEEFRNVYCIFFPCTKAECLQLWPPGCTPSRSAPKVFGHDRIQPRARRLRYHGSFPPSQNSATSPATWQG